MRKSVSLLGGALCALCLLLNSLAPAQEQQQPQLHEEVTVRWWLVPVYAIDQAGAPVLNLTPDELEVYIKGIKVEQFSLHKKEFKVTEKRKSMAPASPTASPQPPAPPQQKMVFLIFDAAWTPPALMAKAKTICDRVLAQSRESPQYVLLSIEPGAGLHYISGPTQDRKLIAQEIKKFISGKKMNYLLAKSYDGTLIRNLYPGSGGERGIESQVYARADRVSSYQKTLGFRSALLTMSLILTYFPQYSKVVYIYSGGGGIAWEPGLGGGGGEADLLMTLGRALNKSGAMVFLINPAGTRDLSADDPGKQNLQVLASESGGRYFAGEEKQIVEQVNNMEGGYYEISFPDKPEYEGQELSFEIRSKKPEVKIYTLRNVGREKSFADMNGRERELLVLNILNNGLNALTTQKVSYVLNATSREGEALVCSLALPRDLARSEWVVYKVARDFATGEIQIDTEQIVSGSANREVRMKWRGDGYRYDIVLAHTKTGAILVAK